MCAGYYPNKFPPLSVMELPFLAPRSLEDNAKVNHAVLSHPLIVKEMADRWNIKYFGPTFLPVYEFMGNKRIASVADMKGVKMRLSGLNARALQAFGAVPTMVTAPEGYTALERGTIGSFGFPYAYTFGAYKMYEVSKYVTDGMAMSGFMCFQGFLGFTGTPAAIANAIVQSNLSPTMVLIGILLLYLFLGMFIDGIGMVLLTVPIILPTIKQLGIDPIVFGVLVVRMVEIGLMTPPVGLNVYVLRGVAKGVSMGDIFRGCGWFVLVDIINVAILLAFPAIILLIPSTMIR